MKISEHIELEELVPKKIFLQKGKDCLLLIDPRLPIVLERIRELCGNRTMTINNWLWNGKYQHRGCRPADCTVGAKYSMHKYGKAADFDIKGMTAEQVRRIIVANEQELMALGLTRMEAGTSWVHIDLKEIGLEHIYIFKP
jgi:uncharacterized protein YcbK (DUF882 family)